ncbi:MAG: TlpA family protein disulfide reductase [Bacteroidetes bacterium]|nr:TlpA family protein disulfide reductase [Bacteroidota bacterium]
MRFKKIQWNKLLPGLLLVFLVAYILSPQLKGWMIAGLMKVGFFKPDVPEVRANGQYKPAPNIQLQDIDHNVIYLENEKGKVVFINFWATWCPPCLAELPSINALYEKEKNNPNIAFVTIDIDSDLPKTTKFMQLKDYHFPVYSAVGAGQLYNDGIPTTLVVNKRGEIVFSHFNRANYNSDQFAAFLEKLAQQP